MHQSESTASAFAELTEGPKIGLRVHVAVSSCLVWHDGFWRLYEEDSVSLHSWLRGQQRARLAMYLKSKDHAVRSALETENRDLIDTNSIVPVLPVRSLFLCIISCEVPKSEIIAVGLMRRQKVAQYRSTALSSRGG